MHTRIFMLVLMYIFVCLYFYLYNCGGGCEIMYNNVSI